MSFPRPQSKPKKLELSTEGEILEEDIYYEKLEKIIKRDFFPELHRIDQIREGTFDEEGKKTKLNEFLNNYNSEDNQSFGQILEKQSERWKEKYWWVYKNKENNILEIKDDELKKLMLEDEKKKTLMLTNFEGENLFLFAPEKNSIQTYTDVNSRNKGEISYENTRFENATLDYLKSSLKAKNNSETDSSNPLPPNHLLLKTPDLQGFKRKENKDKIDLDLLMNNESSDNNSITNKFSVANEINGYDLLKLPSPSPNDFSSPLMTWGEVDSTPLRIDKNTYSIPRESLKRDQIQNKLANSVLKKKKIAQKITEQRMINLLTTPHRLNSDHSSLGSSIKRNSMIKSILKPTILNQRPSSILAPPLDPLKEQRLEKIKQELKRKKQEERNKREKPLENLLKF